MKFDLHSYFKGNTPLPIQKIAATIKAFCVTILGWGLLADYRWLGITAIIGLAFSEALNCYVNDNNNDKH